MSPDYHWHPAALSVVEKGGIPGTCAWTPEFKDSSFVVCTTSLNAAR